MTFSTDVNAGTPDAGALSGTAKRLKEILGQENVLLNELMSAHVTFRCGGPADLFLMPEDLPGLMRALTFLKEEGIPCFVLGRGSNLLVSDSGFRGAVITLKKHMNRITADGCDIFAEAGATMGETAKRALELGLSGFEFAAGIPGTVGGGLIMNAGAYGGEFRDIVRMASVLKQDGTVREVPLEELGLSYRHSALMGTDDIVLSVQFSLKPGDPAGIRAVMDDLGRRRREKQPLEFGSAGSTFKRPEGHFAGALIEQCGLKGFRIGDAEVSEKHAGFVINRGNASSADVLEVIRHVEETVQAQTGIPLEREVRLLGEF